MENNNTFGQFGPTMPESESLDWDSEIEDTGEGSYVILPPGKYPFTVKSFERKSFSGSAKLPPCNQAELHISVDGGPKGKATVIKKLFLVKKQEWTLSQFFVSIGVMKPGSKLRMNWAAVVGATGICELSNREYNGDMYNEIKRFLPPERTAPGPQSPSAPW